MNNDVGVLQALHMTSIGVSISDGFCANACYCWSKDTGQWIDSRSGIGSAKWDSSF